TVVNATTLTVEIAAFTTVPKFTKLPTTRITRVAIKTGIVLSSKVLLPEISMSLMATAMHGSINNVVIALISKDEETALI
ncbi:hypothetical protein, partial [Klebsiella pneumoniae]|uniref:hypothetical protein n=1 Tax=Klebsiella pneumoniae TaxID=573 RepID=UPI003013721F